MNRRQMIGATAGMAAVTAAGLPSASAFAGSASTSAKLKGNIRHSVSRWCYGSIPLEEFAKTCADMGLESIELLGEKDWAIVKKFGLKCAVGYATDYGIPKGFNRVSNHDKLIADFEAVIPKAAEARVLSGRNSCLHNLIK